MASFWPNVWQLVEEVKRRGHECDTFRVSGCSLLEQARSSLACEALEKGCDVTLWLDDDIQFDAVEIARMVELAPEKGVIGAMATTRGRRGRGNVAFLDGPATIPFFGRGGVHEIRAIGLGATAIAAHVYEDIAAEYPELRVKSMHGKDIVAYFRSDIRDGVWFGEDFSFCYRAREVGKCIYLDSRVRLGHVGDYDYQLEDMLGAVPRLDDFDLTVE